MITGVIKDEKKAYKRLVSVNPVAHHYEEKGDLPYIKFGCPVCEAVGNRVQVTPRLGSCMLCGVSLNWNRTIQPGDRVILRKTKCKVKKGEVCMVKDITKDSTGKVALCTLLHNDACFTALPNNLTILDPPEN